MPSLLFLLASCVLLGLGALGCSTGSADLRPVPPAPALGARVTLLQTTDLHHHALGEAQAGSYARIAAYVEGIRGTAGHPVLLVDSGDWTMGTLQDFTLAQRPLALLFMDALHYDCVTLGNHEFDHGEAGLAGFLGAARRQFGFATPIVASNLGPDGLGELASLVGPGRAIQRTRVTLLANGLRVGFIGLMGRDAASDSLRAARFRDWSRDAGFVQELVDDLRGRQGCHLVIALDHAGVEPPGASGEDVELARRVSGIDVIASGHTHHPLASALSVANGAWTTRICCAGCFGRNVARLDLVYRGPGGAELEASGNAPMTDAGLAGMDPPLAADPAFAFLVGVAEREINRALAPLARRLLPGRPYDPDQPAGGVRRPIGHSDQVLRPGPGPDPPEDPAAVRRLPAWPPGPSGLGNFCADALRAAASAQAGMAPERAPCTVGLVASGVLRGNLGEGGGAISLADLFEVMPLGQSPDPRQPGIPGDPVLAAWVEPEDLRALCALQLLGQSGIARPDDYLNLSGLRYELRREAAEAFFAAATAAKVLERARERAQAGSAAARAVLAALAIEDGAAPAARADGGSELAALAAAGNPFAKALAGNSALEPVAAAAQADVGDGADRAADSLDALLYAWALAAIGPVTAFAPDDPACTGSTRPLPPGRVRVALDLDALLGFEHIQARFGIPGGLYRDAGGEVRLTRRDAPGRAAILACRLGAGPAGDGQELKTWMALAGYLSAPPALGGHFADGRITWEYRADGGFRGFPGAGPAVRVRNPGYPLAALEALADTLAALADDPAALADDPAAQDAAP